MSVYLIAQLNSHDRETYANYEAGFMQIFAQFKGKLLSVEEAPFEVEGEWPHTRTVLIEFPTKSDADAWYHSEAYQSLAKHRQAASTGNIVMLKGLSL